MRRAAFALLAMCFVLSAAPVRADHAPVIVVPGRPGVPVMINGYDASYAVVEGDWGLSRPGHVPVTVIYGPTAIPGPAGGAYYPYTGRRPGIGRHEIEPPADRKLPPPAPSYHRSWSTQSDPVAPVTTYPPFDPPPVILAPKDDLPKSGKKGSSLNNKKPNSKK
jgi:hypothetical protein